MNFIYFGSNNSCRKCERKGKENVTKDKEMCGNLRGNIHFWNILNKQKDRENSRDLFYIKINFSRDVKQKKIRLCEDASNVI